MALLPHLRRRPKVESAARPKRTAKLTRRELEALQRQHAAACGPGRRCSCLYCR